MITILICLICIGVYFQQVKNQDALELSIDGFCGVKQPEMFGLVLQALYGSATPQKCVDLVMGMHTAKDKDKYLKNKIEKGRKLQGFSRRASNRYIDRVVRDNYAEFQLDAPQYLTSNLAYKPESWSPVHMLTAAFAHGSWSHVIGNLIFLFAFAATVEAILGYAYFSLVVVLIALLSHVLYSITMLGVSTPPPTLGLSGVVSGIMAMFVFFLPQAKIKCFFWFFIIVKRFSISAWLFVGFFVAWDAYYLLTDNGSSNINFAAHVGGALTGYLLGLMLFRKRKQEIWLL